MADIFSHLFGRRKQKHEDRSPGEDKSRDVSPERTQATANPGNGVSDDYEQLYQTGDSGWTMVGGAGGLPYGLPQQVGGSGGLPYGLPQQMTSPSREAPPPPFLLGVPFRTAGMFGELASLKDVDLFILQASSRLTDTQALLEADYDFTLESEVMDEAQATADKPSSPDIGPSEEEQMAALMEFANL